MTDNTDRSDVRADRFGSRITSEQLSQCLGCAHWEGGRECAAFDGQKVPAEILENEFDHREPHPADNGRQYEAKDGDAEHPMDRRGDLGPGR